MADILNDPIEEVLDGFVPTLKDTEILLDKIKSVGVVMVTTIQYLGTMKNGKHLQLEALRVFREYVDAFEKVIDPDTGKDEAVGTCLSCGDPVYNKDYTREFCSQECVDAHFKYKEKPEDE